MEKRPMYLTILLALSGVITLMNVINLFFSKTQIDKATLAKAVKDTDIEQVYEANQRSLDFSTNMPHKVLVILSLVLLIIAVFFFIRKQILQTNLTYIAYLLLAVIGVTYNYIGSRAILISVYPNSDLQKGGLLFLNIVAAFTLFFNIIFLALTFFKLWQQQKAVEVGETENS